MRTPNRPEHCQMDVRTFTTCVPTDGAVRTHAGQRLDGQWVMRPEQSRLQCATFHQANASSVRLPR